MLEIQKNIIYQNLNRLFYNLKISNCFWDTFGESVIGPAHKKNGIPNQDYWMAKQFWWGNVVVVSDGLGSKSHSDIGSKAACLSVIETAGTFYKNQNANINDILRFIHANWLIKIAPLSASDCSATCLFVIQMNGKLILGRLGDGLIAVNSKIDKNCFILSDNKQDSFSNMTNCLTSNFNINCWETILVNDENYNAVILCTDGIADDLEPECETEFAKSIYFKYKDFNSKKRKKDLQILLNDWPTPKHSDDKTIACLYKKGN